MSVITVDKDIATNNTVTHELNEKLIETSSVKKFYQKNYFKPK